MAIEIDEPTVFENILHYGLLLGAVFQLICIFSVVFLPHSESDQDVHEEIRPSQQSTSAPSSHNKKGKKEKKKNR